MNENAIQLCEIWNDLLLHNRIEVCVDELKDLGINDVKILKLVYRQPGQSIKYYLDILQVPNSTFTNTLNRLIKKELLVRQMDEKDLRSYSLRLTDKGIHAVEQHLEAEKELFDHCLARLSEQEQDMFVSLLLKLVTE